MRSRTGQICPVLPVKRAAEGGAIGPESVRIIRNTQHIVGSMTTATIASATMSRPDSAVNATSTRPGPRR